MHRGFLKLALVAAAALCATGGRAQEAPQDAGQDETIIVQGKKLPPKVVHRYVRQVTSTIDGQLSRFQDPICPAVAGFPEDYARIVVERIRRVARDVGAPVAGEKCRANLVVIAAADADALVRDFRRKRPAIFNGVNNSDLLRAYRPGPVHMWNSVLLLNEDNQRQTGMILTVKSASIINLPTKQVMLGSTIVIDDDALDGKTLTQIADYAAMRALSNARPPREGLEADTIMTLFDPSVSPPLSFTEVDRSYLKGLYKGDPMARGTTAMGRISRQISLDAKARGIDTSSDGETD